jgi:hypothetical protein
MGRILRIHARRSVSDRFWSASADALADCADRRVYGCLNSTGTYPTGAEVLVFLDAETVTRAKAASRNADNTTVKSSRVDGRSSRSRNSDAASVDEEKPVRDE